MHKLQQMHNLSNQMIQEVIMIQEINIMIVHSSPHLPMWICMLCIYFALLDVVIGFEANTSSPEATLMEGEAISLCVELRGALERSVTVGYRAITGKGTK